MIAGNDNRLSLRIQNSDTTPVAYAGVPGEAVGGPVLRACGADDDGTGGEVLIDDYTGPVFLYAVGGGGSTGSVRYFETFRVPHG